MLAVGISAQEIESVCSGFQLPLEDRADALIAVRQMSKAACAYLNKKRAK